MDRRTIVSAVVLIGLVVTVAAATSFTISQTTPSVSTTNALMRANCTNPLAANPTTLVKGAAPDKGYILFYCSSPTAPTDNAFDVTTSVTATPTFTLPLGYVNVTIVSHPLASPPTCPTSPSSFTKLTSGTSLIVNANPWDYCVGYDITSFSGTISPFTITWTWIQ